MDDLLLAKFDRSPTEEVRVSLREFNGAKFLDIRVYAKPGDSDKYMPTKKGVAFAPRLLPKLRDALYLADKALSEEGILLQAVKP